MTTTTCQDLRAREDAYLAHSLSHAESSALEQHAAACSECSAWLEARTRRDVARFAPPLPDVLRARTLAAVRDRRRSVRQRRWLVGAAAAAMVAAALVRPSTTRSIVVPAVAAIDTAVPAPLAMASQSSAGEFAALDEAARELQEAIAVAPQDAELRGFLASVLARRAELERRVKDAAS